jgi:hypothetical protein
MYIVVFTDGSGVSQLSNDHVKATGIFRFLSIVALILPCSLNTTMALTVPANVLKSFVVNSLSVIVLI